jgi:hypothetical protein
MLRTSITAWSARCHGKTFGTLRSRVKSRLPDHEKPLVTADFVNPRTPAVRSRAAKEDGLGGRPNTTAIP